MKIKVYCFNELEFTGTLEDVIASYGEEFENCEDIYDLEKVSKENEMNRTFKLMPEEEDILSCLNLTRQEVKKHLKAKDYIIYDNNERTKEDFIANYTSASCGNSWQDMDEEEKEEEIENAIKCWNDLYVVNIEGYSYRVERFL